MNFLALDAGAAWWLLAGVGVLVLGLYLLRPSPRRIGIASHVIWTRVLKAHRRDADRLRWWISLIIAGLIALGLALAFTQPEWSALSGGARRLVLVMDNSASLAARTQDGATRWLHAVKLARSAIDGAGAGSQFMLLDTMSQAGAPAWEKREDALARLERLKPAMGAGRFPLAPPSSADGRVLEAVFITDGVGSFVAPKDYRVQSVFELATNLGITAFEIRAQPADPKKHEAFLEVFNASNATEQPELTLTGANGKVIRQSVAIPGQSTASAVIDVSVFPPGAVRAAVVSGSDAFEADNVAFSFVPAKHVIKVALVTSGNPILERVLRLQPRLLLSVLRSPKVGDADGFDALILDKVTPPASLTLPTLMIRPERGDLLPASTGELRDASINIWNAQHPVMQHLSLRDVVVDRALRWPVEELTKKHAVVLASDAGKGPLIVASAGEPRWVATTFDLSDSNFALQAGFPVLMANALHWLTGEAQAMVRSPGWVEVPAPGGRVLGLDGKEVPARQVSNGVAFDAPGAGFYTVVTAERVVRVAVNLFDRDVIAVNHSKLAAQTQDAEAAAKHRGVEPWVLLLFLALGFLVVEWLTYHRRLTV